MDNDADPCSTEESVLSGFGYTERKIMNCFPGCLCHLMHIFTRLLCFAASIDIMDCEGNTWIETQLKGEMENRAGGGDEGMEDRQKGRALLLILAAC